MRVETYFIAVAGGYIGKKIASDLQLGNKKKRPRQQGGDQETDEGQDDSHLDWDLLEMRMDDIP